MTASLEAGPEATCLQVFTERYDEFIFGNDTVTAFGPAWGVPRGLHSKDRAPAQVKPCWQPRS